MRKDLPPTLINKYACLFGIKRRMYLGIFKESDKHLIKRITLKAMKIKKFEQNKSYKSKVNENVVRGVDIQ